MKRDAMEREAVKILRTNHPVVLDNIVWLRRAIADALLKVQRRERRRTSAMLRERADAAVDKTIAILTKNLGRTDIVPSVIPDMKYFSAAIRAAVLKGGRR